MLRLTIVCRDAIQVTRMERSFCCSWSGNAWRLRLSKDTTYIIPSDTQDWISDVNLLSCPSGCSILLPWSRTRQGRWTGQPYQRSLLPLCSWWPTFRQQKGLLVFLLWLILSQGLILHYYSNIATSTSEMANFTVGRLLFVDSNCFCPKTIFRACWKLKW